MKRRNHWVLFAILLLGLISLSPSDNRNFLNKDDATFTESQPLPHLQEEKAPGHIKVAVQMEPGEFAKLQELSQTFAEEHHVSVELTNESGEDAYSLFGHMLALHDAPDVLLLDNNWVRSFAEQGYLLPADSYFSGSAIGNSLSGLQAFGEWNGYVWAVPKDLDPYVLVYNPQLLSQLGFNALPNTMNDWNRLYSSQMQAAVKGTVPFLLAGNFNDPASFLSLLRRMGGGSLKDGLSQLDLTNGEKEALLLLEKARPQIYNEPAPDKEQSGLWSKLDSGQTAIALVPYSQARTRPSAKLRIELPASLDAGMMLTGAGRSFVVSASSADPETADEWITAMTDVSQQKGWYELTGKLPALKSLYDAAASMEISAWLPEGGGGKGLVWSLPVESRMPELLKGISGLSASFLTGSLSREDFIKQYDAAVNQK